MNLIWQKEQILISSLSCKMARKDLRLFTLLFSQSYLPFQVVWPIEGSLTFITCMCITIVMN